MAFTDYKHVIDQAKTSAITQPLRKRGVDEPYMKVIEDIYKDNTETINFHRKWEKSKIKKGVRQGGTMYPKLCTGFLWMH